MERSPLPVGILPSATGDQRSRRDIEKDILRQKALLISAIKHFCEDDCVEYRDAWAAIVQDERAAIVKFMSDHENRLRVGPDR